MTSTLLAIGDVAAATGVSARTLRYYDELGLIKATTRVGGKRRFERSEVDRVDFVRRAQRVGFSLDAIGLLLNDTTGGWNAIVAQKLEDLRAQRDELNSMISELERVQSCGCGGVTTCSSQLVKPR